MVKLERFQEYNREEIHDIFSPNTIFTPQSGTWGLHGIVKVPDRSKDYVFMVTFERRQGSYQFKESVSESGVLIWQSQPSQGFDDKRILDFINHDHTKNNIYLFLRTKRNLPYTYLGKLAYLDHDKHQEKPVHFKWQILDWEYGDNLLNNIGLSLISDGLKIGSTENLILTDKPNQKKESNEVQRNFNGKVIDFADNEKNNKKLGDFGEELVIEFEKKWLIENNRADLAEKVLHVSQKIGDGTGFDILSYQLDGTKKYIEVKTTRGGIGTPFYLSANEIDFARINDKRFIIYRVYNFRNGKGLFYKLTYNELDSMKKEVVNYRIIPR